MHPAEKPYAAHTNNAHSFFSLKTKQAILYNKIMFKTENTMLMDIAYQLEKLSGKKEHTVCNNA